MGREAERVRGKVCEKEREANTKREEEEKREREREGAREWVASNIQLIIRQTFLMNEELPIPPSFVSSVNSLPWDRKRFFRRVDSRNFDSVSVSKFFLWKLILWTIWINYTVNYSRYIKVSQYHFIDDLRLLINKWETSKSSINIKKNRYRGSISDKDESLLVKRTDKELALRADSIRYIDWVAYELLIAENVQTWQFHWEYQPMTGSSRLRAP